MVHTSNKQHLLDNIGTTIMHLLMVEFKMQLNPMDANVTWHPNDDLEESDDDMFDHAQALTHRPYELNSEVVTVTEPAQKVRDWWQHKLLANFSEIGQVEPIQCEEGVHLY